MYLNYLDWIVITAFFILMLIIGAWSYSKNRDSKDYFVAGGKLPWWLSGISHHVSGYSGAVFVAYAGLAYTHGVSLYVWWAFTIAVSMLLSVNMFPVRWVRLRIKHKIESPLEYLSTRYNIPTQQIMAWSGVFLKLFDVGAKWFAIAILLNGFTGMSILSGILLAGGVSLIYITIGGLWAAILTDLAQFIVQVAAGIVMFVFVIIKLKVDLNFESGFEVVTGLWSHLPEGNSQLFNHPYTAGFALAFLFINFLSYNGGTWNLATRYIASPNEKETKRAARLSALLYLLWPLILFFPMWAGPVLFPGMEDPTQELYARLTIDFLPAGLVGLVLASMFANTMSMTSADANTISAVIVKDILPAISDKFKNLEPKQSLKTAWISTFIFTFLTILIATQAEQFGGVLGLIIDWFGALVGPMAVPMLLGLLPMFKKCDSKAAIGAIVLGLATFIFIKAFEHNGTGEIIPVISFILSSKALTVSMPLIMSLFTYILFGLFNINKPVPERVDKMINSLLE